MTNSNNLINPDKLFRQLALLTVLTIYLLILAGGIVRSTDSGMGCPDWPKCFGQWTPPTNVSELPANYQEIYAHKGYSDTTFNATKTWIEYLNRLLGVLTGLFVFATVVASLRYVKRKPLISIASFVAFVLVGVQGWLGAKVVSNLLAPWIVTLHMLLALVIVGILLLVAAKSYQLKTTSVSTVNVSSRLRVWLSISSAVLLIQILLGTQVRESVDEVSAKLGGLLRDQWIGQLSEIFVIHRSFSWLVLLSVAVWVSMALRLDRSSVVYRSALWVVALTVTETAIGAIMAHFSIPRLAQPAHLVIAVLLLGIQFICLLFTHTKRQEVSPKAVETFSH